MYLTRKTPLKSGGKIKYVKGPLTKYTKTHDSVPAILQVGEMIIPKKYVKKVEEFLKHNHMPLPLP
jgi:hypothetical protein